MFDALSDRLERIAGRLRSRGRLTDADLDEALAEIRTALLEADVELGVVRSFTDGRAGPLRGADLSKSLTPGQQVIKAVHEELVRILGGETLKLTYASSPPTVVLLAGLQGSGKTTTVGQAGPLVEAAGPQPAARGGRPPAARRRRAAAGARRPGRGAPSSASRPTRSPWPGPGWRRRRRLGRDVCIVDTAGRLAIDEELMDEVRRISAAVDPHYTLLVIDAMTGQDAVATADGLPPDPGPRRGHPHQARRRRPGRGRALRQRGGGPAHRLRLHRRAAGRLRPVPPRPHGRPHPGHGRHAQPHRAGRADHGRATSVQRRRPGSWRAASPSRTSSTSSSRSKQDGLAGGHHDAHARDVQGDAPGGRPDRRPGARRRSRRSSGR